VVERTAEDLAAAYVARAPRSAAEVRAYLLRTGFEGEQAERAVCWLQERGWLDDAAAAEDYARKLVGAGHAPASAVAKLCGRGVTEELARRAVAQASGGAGERALLRAALERRLGGRAAAQVRDARERARLARWLLARGYGEDVVREELGGGGEHDE
jgi:regulatory protein